MEYTFSDTDREIIQEIKTESEVELNKRIGGYIAVLVRQNKMGLGDYTLVLDSATGLPVKMVANPEGQK